MFAITFDAGKNVAFELSAEQVTQLIGHANVHQHVFMIGLKNILQDCHASITREDYESDEAWIAAKREKAMLKLGAMMNGELRGQSGERKAKVDSFTTFARRHILSLLTKERRKELAEHDDKGASVLDALFAKNEAALRPIVQAQMEAAQKYEEEKAKLAASLDLSL